MNELTLNVLSVLSFIGYYSIIGFVILSILIRTMPLHIADRWGKDTGEFWFNVVIWPFRALQTPFIVISNALRQQNITFEGYLSWLKHRPVRKPAPRIEA